MSKVQMPEVSVGPRRQVTKYKNINSDKCVKERKVWEYMCII